MNRTVMIVVAAADAADAPILVVQHAQVIVEPRPPTLLHLVKVPHANPHVRVLAKRHVRAHANMAQNNT